MRAFNDLRRLALNAGVLFLALLPIGAHAQQTPQAIPLSSAACRLDGGAGCGLLNTSTAVSTALDLITSTRGSIFYRGASGWAGLAPGTSTYVLTSNGAGADPSWQASAASGANTALSNLASVAINTTLASGAGTTLALTATAPAAITTAQAGTPLNLTASAAVAGSSVAGAAAGGGITLRTGNAARLTSGNANGGDVVFTLGTGIGTGRQGTLSAPGAGANSETFGLGSVAGGARTSVFGNSANGGTYTDAVGLGYNVSVGSNDSVLIGSGAATGNTAGVGKNVAIGKSAQALGSGAIGIGESATGSTSSSIAIGQSALASGNSGPVCIGASCLASNSTGSVVIGNSASANSTTANILIGGGAASTASNQMVLGGTTSSITTAYVGSGVTSTAASAVTFGTTGGSGSDNAGAKFTLQPGVGTGTAASGDFYVRTGVPRATGSTAQSPTVRQSIRAKQTTLTESSATSVVTIPVAASKVVGGKLIYTVSANDGTDFQSTTGEVIFSAVDKAGTVTTAITASAETSAASAGTLTSTWTAVASTTNVILKCNAVSSLSQTVLEVHTQLVLNGDDTTGTVTWN